MNLAKYRKFLVALIGAAVSVASVMFTDTTWLPPVVSLLTALGVYQVPNKK